MDFLPKKSRALLKFYGGKSFLARRIISLFPEHTIYCEGFAGAAAVLLNKKRSDVEILSDVNPSLINLLTVVGSPLLYPLFRDVVVRSGKNKTGLEYNESVFEMAKLFQGHNSTGVGAAVAYLVKCRYSRIGMGKSFSWSDRFRGGQYGELNAWMNLKKDLDSIHSRLNGVQVKLVGRIDGAGYNVFDVMKEVEGPDTVFYLDPPYLHETRSVKSAFGVHEMTSYEHEKLLKFLLGVQAKAIFISCYWSDLYSAILGVKGGGWDYTYWNCPNNSGMNKVKERRREYCWFRI